MWCRLAPLSWPHLNETLPSSLLLAAPVPLQTLIRAAVNVSCSFNDGTERSAVGDLLPPVGGA